MDNEEDLAIAAYQAPVMTGARDCCPGQAPKNCGPSWVSTIPQVAPSCAAAAVMPDRSTDAAITRINASAATLQVGSHPHQLQKEHRSCLNAAPGNASDMTGNCLPPKRRGCDFIFHR